MSSTSPEVRSVSKHSGLRGLFYLVASRLGKVTWKVFKLVFDHPPVWWVLRYITMVVLLIQVFFIFMVLNRTRITGKQHIPRQTKRVLYVGWHESFIDSFMMGLLFVPRAFWRPAVIPYNLPDSDNLYKNWFIALMMRLVKNIPVRRSNCEGKSDPTATRQAGRAIIQTMAVLRNACVTIFPGGGRHINGERREPKLGVGHLALCEDDILIVPVAFTGMNRVQPLRKKAGDPPATWMRPLGKTFEWILYFRIGQRINVRVGQPIKPWTIREWAGEGTREDQVQRVARRVMGRVNTLRSLLEQQELREQQEREAKRQ